MNGGRILSAGAVLLSLSPVWGATWTQYEAGPFRIISDAGDRVARERLLELEQLRHSLEAFLGKTDIGTVWPIEIILFPNQKEYGPHVPPSLLVEGPDATLTAWMAETPLPHDLLRAITRQLIEDNAGRMPEPIEQALRDLMASVQVNKENKVTLGAAPGAGELSEDRMRAWAKIQMLATLPEFAGKLHVYLGNLQQGADENLATHNAFAMTLAELDKRAEDYLAAGKFAAIPAPGIPVIPGRDYVESRVPDAAVNVLLDALKNGGKDFPADSPRGLLKQGTRESLQAAAKINPKWVEPHLALAELEYDPVEKAKELKLAAELAPRRVEIWEALAKAQTDSQLFAEAEKSWIVAERNAPDDADKARIHKARLDMSESRVEYETRQKKRRAQEDADDLEQVKKAAEARIHAAEDVANKQNGSLKPGAKIVPWWDDQTGEKLSGTLTNVDCLDGDALKLTVKPATGAAVKLMIPDSHNIAVKGADEVQFACGAQKAGKKINVVHDGKPDAHQGTVGNVHTVEFP